MKDQCPPRFLLCVIFFPADNSASFKLANQSAQFENFSALLAVDGHIGPEWDGGHCAITSDTIAPLDPAWWFVDLNDTFTVYGVTIHSSSKVIAFNHF